MDRDSLRAMVQGARGASGVVTPAALREAVLDTSLAAELLTEQATTLSHLGRRLDRCSARLRELRAAPASTESDRVYEAERTELRRLRWELLVVKEAMGLRGARADIDATWPLPPVRRTAGG